MSYRIPPTIAFWIVAATTTTVLLSSAAPSPLYPVYQQLFGFSAFTLTVVFAIYVVTLVGALLTVGSVSDHVGRRPVLGVSLVLLILSMVVFAESDGVPMLVLARALQGVATGALLGTVSAAMVDLAPSPRIASTISTISPPLGLALGAAVAGALVQYAPMPRILIYLVVGIGMAGLLATFAFLPETSPMHGFSSARHVAGVIAPKLSVPAEIRAVFLGVVPAMLSTWALGGLYLSLGTSIEERTLGVTNHAAAGAVLFAFFASAAVAAPIVGRLRLPLMLTVGYGSLAVGVLTTMTATLVASTPAYVVGSVIAGVGFGTSWLGVMTTITRAVSPGQRAAVFATVFAVSYTAFSVPAVVAGLLTSHVGLTTTAVGYAVFIVALVAAASVAAVVLHRRGAADERIESSGGDEHVEAAAEHAA